MINRIGGHARARGKTSTPTPPPFGRQHALANGMGLIAVRDLLGHSIVTTSKYLYSVTGHTLAI